MADPAPIVIPAATITVTSVLQKVFDDVGEPALVAAIGAVLAAIPGVGPALAAAWNWVMNAPVLGAFLQGKIKALVDQLIANGVIEIKIGILRYLSAAAQAKWAPEVTLLQQYDAEGKTFTPEEQAAYDAALQNLVKNRPGIINA